MQIRDQVRLRTASLAPAQTPNGSQAEQRAWKAQLRTISARFSCVLPQSLRSSGKAPRPHVHSLRWELMAGWPGCYSGWAHLLLPMTPHPWATHHSLPPRLAAQLIGTQSPFRFRALRDSSTHCPLAQPSVYPRWQSSRKNPSPPRRQRRR